MSSEGYSRSHVHQPLAADSQLGGLLNYRVDNSLLKRAVKSRVRVAMNDIRMYIELKQP